VSTTAPPPWSTNPTNPLLIPGSGPNFFPQAPMNVVASGGFQGAWFPAMALFLMWFRRGWTLTWSWLLLPLLLAGSPGPLHAQPDPNATDSQAEAHRGSAVQWFADLWLTGDQQGRLLMQVGDYRGAAARFQNPQWKGVAYYYAEDFMLAAEYFSRSDSDDALFNEANARAQARDYVRAVQRYDRLLARTPDYPGASHNRQRVQALIDEINRLSESQQQEPGDSGNSTQLSSDDAIPAQGADEISWEQADTLTLTAQEILGDPATADMWLRSVQQDPANFLAIKFGMQLQRDQGSGDSGP
jgi:Ca-activated chloride channel family protein